MREGDKEVGDGVGRGSYAGSRAVESNQSVRCVGLEIRSRLGVVGCRGLLCPVICGLWLQREQKESGGRVETRGDGAVKECLVVQSRAE